MAQVVSDYIDRRRKRGESLNSSKKHISESFTAYISEPDVTDEPEAQSYVDCALERLYEKMNWVFDLTPIPDRKFEFEDHLKIARTMRQMMDDNNKEACCCICSRRRRNIEIVSPLPNLADVPNLSLLMA